MKKKSILSKGFAVAIILTLGIWTFNTYLQPILRNNQDQSKTIDIAKNTNFTFVKHPQQGNISGIEMELTGTVSSNFELILSDGSTDVHVAKIKGNNIDFVYKNTWTSDRLHLEIIPTANSTGKITATCRFLEFH